MRMLENAWRDRSRNLALSYGGGLQEEIIAVATLHSDLGAQSIDLLVIVFRLERAFGIHPGVVVSGTLPR